MLALNIITNAFETVAHYTASESEYTLHKPNRGPYQDATMKVRTLWEHKEDEYILWVVQSKHFLMLHLSQTESEGVGIGEEIDDYKLDKHIYMQKLKAFKESRRSETHTTTTTTTTTTVTTTTASSSVVPPPKKKMRRTETANDLVVAPAFVAPIAPAPPVAHSKTSEAKSKEEASSVDIQRFLFGDDDDEPNSSLVPLQRRQQQQMQQEVFAEQMQQHLSDTSNALNTTHSVSPNTVAMEVSVVESATDSSAAADSVTVESAAESAAVGSAATESAAAESAAADLVATESAAADSVATESAPVDSAAADVLKRLQEENEALRERAQAAEKDADHERTKHKNYMKTKQREVSKLKEGSVSKEVFERTKQELSEAKSIASFMTDDERTTMQASKRNPKVTFMTLIEMCNATIKKVIADAQTQASNAAGSSTTAGLPAFEFEDNGWNPITDSTIVSALKSLVQTRNLVTYAYKGNNYEASVVTALDYEILQKNIDTGMTRFVRDPSLHQAKVDDEKVTKQKALDLLFGSESIVPLGDDFLSETLKEVRFDIDMSYEMCRELAELAQVFSSIASGFEYIVDANTQATDSNALHFTTHTDGEKDFNSELFVKPMALFNWLTLAQSRGYKAARLIMHGCRYKAYQGMRADPLGFNMEYAGHNGQAYGEGVYFGLSDHATVGYNQGSGFPPGSCILALLLTKEQVGWQHHHHGGYSRRDMDKEQAKQYKTIMFGTPVEGTDNAIVVHETPLLLQLGYVHAFNRKKGWLVPRSTAGDVN